MAHGVLVRRHPLRPKQQSLLQSFLWRAEPRRGSGRSRRLGAACAAERRRLRDCDGGGALCSAAGWTAVGGSPVVVAQGETVDSLSSRYGVPTAALLSANGLSSAAEVHG